MPSENGWNPARVGPESLTWVTVPGTKVNLQFMTGWPLKVLRALAADFNAYIEPLRDQDSASYTPTNSVATSNHLNGTAMDLNWDTHPFHAKGTFTTPQMKVVRELLEFYEDTVFWAGDWKDPIDEMHWQMGYGTFNNPKVGDFIARKIRPDGFSTFRRGGTTTNKKDVYAQAVISEGQRRGITPRGIQIALATCLVESNLLMYANAGVPESLNLPHDAVGSDHDSVGLFQQRCPMWGPASVLMDPALSAGLFYDRLAKLNYNGGDSPGSYAQAVQRSAFPDRYDTKFSEAVAIYSRLVAAPPPTAPKEGFLMALTDAEQREVLELLRQESGYRRISRSPLRHVNEGPSETINGFAWNTDGSVHVLLIMQLARLGDPDAISLLTEVANLDPARNADRAHDRLLAQAILNSLSGVSSLGSTPATGQVPGMLDIPVVASAPAPVFVEPVFVEPVFVQPPDEVGEEIQAATIPAGDMQPDVGHGGVQSNIAGLEAEIATLREALQLLTNQIRS